MPSIKVDTRYKKLYSQKNLKLAWDRISTSSSNLYYKNYYRRLFSLYQIDAEENIKNLSASLKNKIYKPSDAIKFYKTKENGLLRPFTFISVEDQIVYQGIANVLLLDFWKKRKSIELKYVFSNLFCDDPENDIFLFKKWNQGYLAYKRNVINNFNSGLVYTAHYDLAAFYDTVDHHSLTSAVILNLETMFSKTLFDQLALWSNPNTESDARRLYHSIPQGPLASSVFAELYLLPLDETLIKNNITYSRYVDDIIIQGKTELEVKKAVALLDKTCKEKGLVPQTSKFKIFLAQNSGEAVGKKPSIDSNEKKELFSSEANILEVFTKASNPNDFDSTTIRYILKCYRESDILVPLILELFEKHYELSEEFCSYLKFFCNKRATDYKKAFEIKLINDEIPYDYVKKEIWELFSVMNTIGFDSSDLTKYAKDQITSSGLSPESRYGIYSYLSTAKNGLFINFLQYERKSLLTSLQVKFITPEIIESTDFSNALPELQKRSSFENIQKHINNLLVIGELDSIAFQSLRLEPLHPKKIDTFDFYLKEDYGITTSIKWKKILHSDYKQLNELIYYIHIYYKSDKTAWINMVDTFCDVLLKALIPSFEIWIPHPNGWPCLTLPGHTPSGIKPKDHGVLLNELKTKRLIPNIVNKLEQIHERRCRTPLSHPKDFKTMSSSTLLSRSERNQFFYIFKDCMKEIISIIESNSI